MLYSCAVLYISYIALTWKIWCKDVTEWLSYFCIDIYVCEQDLTTHKNNDQEKLWMNEYETRLFRKGKHLSEFNVSCGIYILSFFFCK